MAAAARLPSIDPPAYDEDNDSMAEYADDVNPNGLNEDGSFIGKYRKDRNPEQSSAFATLV